MLTHYRERTKLACMAGPSTAPKAAKKHPHPALEAIERAPPDDEPVTPEDEAALEEALADVREGRTVSHDEVRRRRLSGK
jgi:predicted transcriptional regulator